MTAESGGEPLDQLCGEIRACRICAERFAATKTAHTPRPVPWLSDKAPILLAGQAPGARVHASGKPFDDPSGDRLRDWLGVSRETFYDKRYFAVLPMAFCFPGYDARGSDLPPPKVCAATWREQSLAAMPQIRLTLLIGSYAQRWHGADSRMSMTEFVRTRLGLPDGVVPLPHPSWRNTGWLKKNPWFEAEVVPELRGRVSSLIAGV